MKTTYPKWFNASYPPSYKPLEPSETVLEYKEISRVTTSTYDHFDITELPENTNSIAVNVERDYYDHSITGVDIIFEQKKTVPNPNYNKLYKEHQKLLEVYNEQYKEWKKWKKVWDEEVEVKAKEERLRTYKKLKKEFES